MIIFKPNPFEPGQVVTVYFGEQGTVVGQFESDKPYAEDEPSWLIDFGNWRGVFLTHEIIPKVPE